MKTTRGLWLLSLLLLVGAAFLRFHWAHRTTEMRGVISRMAEERASNERETQRVRTEMARRQGERNRGAAPVSAADRKPTEGAALAAEYRKRQQAIRAWADREYAPFCRTAGLNSDQIEKFEKAVTDHWLRWSDAVAVGFSQGIGASQAPLQTLARSEGVRFQAEEAAALGPVAMDQLKQFNRTVPIQPVASSVAGLLFDTPEPLTASQGEALTQLLANTSPRYQKGGVAGLLDLNAPAVLAQAQTILSPGQIDALRTVLESTPANQGVGTIMARASQLSSGGSGPGKTH